MIVFLILQQNIPRLLGEKYCNFMRKHSTPVENTRNMKIKLMFFNPIVLISYIRCALIALFNPHLEWKKIDHNINNIEK